MKKALLVLAVLCVAGIFSAKAQSASDSSYARDLSYTYVNAGNLPFTVTDSLSDGGKILKDIRANHRAKGYAIILTSTKRLNIFLRGTSWSGGWDEYLHLLDSNYNQIDYNDDASGGGSRIIRTLAPGNYYILASEYYSGSTSTNSYTLTIDEIVTTPLNALSYTPLGSVTDTTVLDTFVASYPNIYYDDYLYKAKGYSFQGTQNDIIAIHDYYNDALYILMDHNYNILRASYYTITMQLPQTGTYYLAILDEDGYSCETRIRAFRSLPTYYIDGVNGSDSRDGLTPQTAIFTLDTAIARTGGIGKYYITDDYTFRNHVALQITFAEIYPYQKDIRLYMPDDGYADVIGVWPGHLVFGEQGSNYYFIIDSIRSTNFDDFLDADAYGSYLEVNNLKITNSHIPSTVIWGDDIILRNCEFTNDTIGDYFIGMEENFFYSIKFINCNISQNYFVRDFIYFEYDSAKVTFENTTVAGNTFNYEAGYFWGGATVNLTSGSWRNNRFATNYQYNGNPNISAQNAAGFWIDNSTVNFGADFSMDPNNYLCIDSLSTINIAGNITAPVAAQIYPHRWDNDDDHYYSNYYEGRRVLWGSTSLLANNYQKFSIAQADNSSLW